MNRAELAAVVAQATGENATHVEDILRYAESAIVKAVTQGEWVELRYFGKFVTKKQAARRIKMPKTGIWHQIPATTRVSFEASKYFKASVAGRKPGGQYIEARAARPSVIER
ncbi:HU family DNA-binding protein [Dechloromonas sp. A34]|uniref:HU family DNA-binding protein n=1 Tax=Dechloromonas sp. A34 TaxID=447588 RepID=UPI00224911A6|nr:HU family DNA-binding protein [Dechloromonas sp. A34]